jgi:Arc/MetJ-type ribon-helix-helix transcriptional regulator
MPKITVEISPELARQIDRIVRDGWFADEESVISEAVEQFVDGKSFLGDSPRMLHRFAADALNESKPDTALKFVDRALALLVAHKVADLHLYQQLVELRVQILLIVGRDRDAMASLEEAQERLPNNPSIRKWIEKLKVRSK